MNDELEFWIIDDDTLYVRELLRVLREELSGTNVIKFTTTAPVLTALKNGKRPAAVILDMMLAKDEWDNPMRWPSTDNPAKNGIEVAEALVACGVNREVIGVVTAVFDAEQLGPLEAIRILPTNILIKPADTERIRAMVRRMVAFARSGKSSTSTSP